LADPKDVKWTAGQLKKNLVFNHEYYMGHMTFAIGKEMSFFTVDVMHILNKANGKKYIRSDNVLEYEKNNGIL